MKESERECRANVQFGLRAPIECYFVSGEQLQRLLSGNCLKMGINSANINTYTWGITTLPSPSPISPLPSQVSPHPHP